MDVTDPNTASVSRANIDYPLRRWALTLKDRRFIFIALITLLAVRLLAIFWLPFVDTTEARYVEIARKMVETCDWITPQFDYGVPFWGKPPLHTWLSAIGMKALGVNPFGARIFVFGTALGVLGLVFTWVRQHKNTDHALVVIMVLASSIMFFGASAFVMTDMVMVLGTTLSMVAFYNCITGGQSSAMWGLLFFVGISLGLLAKGPVALVITVIAILPWLLLTGHWRRLTALPWVSGLLIAVALTLPWYILAEIKTPGFLRYFIIGEHVERFLVPGWQGDLYGSGHEKPKGIIWFYGLTTFLPWTVFALALLPRAKALFFDVLCDGVGWYSYLALWSIAPLVLFTPAANILAAYTLPGLPAASVLLVSLWTRGWGAPGLKTRAAIIVAVGGVAVLFLGVTIASFFFPNSLALKSERELVAAAKASDPEIAFTYWGARSYSAEFYTHGRVTFTDQTNTFETLAGNSQRDAVAISSSVEPEILPFLRLRFERMGTFNRRVLWIERIN